MSDEDVKADDCFDDGQQHCPDKQPGLQFKHRVALLKFRARRWKHQAVLQVERNSWSRQYIWATSVLPTLFGNRRLVALRAIQTGLYHQYCPDFEKEENKKKNENEIENSDQRKQNSLVTKWAGLLKSRVAYTAVVLTASIKKQADECIRGMLHRWKVRKRVDRTQRRRCFNRLFYWAADKQYLTSLRKWSVEATNNDEFAVGSACDASNSTTEGADSESSEPDLAAVCTVNWCPKVQPKQLYSEYRVACTFICLDATEKGDQAVWLPMVTGWDTMSTVNVIVQDRVLSSWKWISKGGWVTGVGGKRHQVLGTVEVPSQKMTYMGEAKPLVASVVPGLPHNVQMLIGLDTILPDQYDIKCDMPGWRVYVRATGETVRLDLVSSVLARRQAGPKCVLSLCAGLLVEVAVLLELGWDVVTVYVVESEDLQRRVAKANFGDLLQFVSDDVRKALPDWIYTAVFACFAGPTCSPWSRLRNSPGGFKEPEADVFRACCAHFAKLEPGCHKFLENVVIHACLMPADGAEQEKLCGGVLWALNALDVGSPSSRQRRYFSPTADWDVVFRDMRMHMCQDFAADVGAKFCSFEVPCVVAWSGTKAKIWVYQRGATEQRLANSDERDRLQGCKAGFSCGSYTLSVTDDDRNGLNGRAFSSDAVWAITRTWREIRRSVPAILAVAEDYRTWPSSEQMRVYTSMYKQNPNKLSSYLTTLAVDLTMPLLDLAAMMSAQYTTPFQTKAPGDVKPGLGPSADYCVDCQIRDNTHQEVTYHKDFWILMLFFKKKGRTVVAEFDGESYKVGDILEALRPLRNYTPLNGAIAAGLPAWWAQFCPDIEAIRSVFPKAVKWLAVFDCRNAFHRVGIHPESRRLCVSKYRATSGRTRLLQAKGGDQGVSAMALFYTLWVRYGYNHFFNEAWWNGSTKDPKAPPEAPWWENFQDDGIIISVEEDPLDCEIKLFLMTVVSKLMGQEVSTKQEWKVTKEVLFCGLIWTVYGITIGETAVTYLTDILLKQPAGIKQARMLRGVVVQARSAFRFSAGELLKFGKLVAAISAVIEKHAEIGVFKWTSEAAAAVVELAERLSNQPRAYTSPELLTADGYCLCIRGDADPDAIVTSLWLIHKNDANDVTCEDFEHEDPNHAVLLGIRPKSLNKSATKWHISEKELLCMVYGVEKFGKLLTECASRWALKADKSKWTWHCGQLVPDVAKICFASDSSSALGMVLTLNLPSGKLEYLTPKIERVTGYMNTVACTLHWPLARLLMPGAGDGPTNSLCDWICRTIGELKRMRGVEVNEDVDVPDPCFAYEETEQYTACVCLAVGSDEDDAAACLMTDNSLTHSDEVYDTSPEPEVSILVCGIPKSMTAKVLPLSTSEWKEIAKAYMLDTGEWSSVRICDIFAVCNNIYEGSSQVRTKIAAWIGKLFFPVSVPGLEEMVLYTPRSAVRRVDGSDEPDLTKELVLVIPANARVAISSAAIADDDEDLQSGAGGNDMRHDVIWWAHNAKVPHARQHDSIVRAASVGWWPAQEVEVKYHYRYCSVCTSLRLALRHVGMGVGAQKPFLVVQMDDAPLSEKLRKLPGVTYTSVLVFCCVASGKVTYALRRDQGSAEFAFLFVLYWIRYNGIPDALWSDNAPAYISKVTALICEMLGVKDRITNALGSHSRFVERAIANARKVLYQAEVVGDAMCDRDLELMMAYGDIDMNQVKVTDGSTVFERTHGMEPSTAADLTKVCKFSGKQVAEAVKSMSKCDAAMVNALRTRCTALMAERNIQQDKRARYNYGMRLVKEDARGTTDFKTVDDGLVLGDKVSYEGNKFFLLDEEGQDEGRPSKALIRNCAVETDERWVEFSLLRPCSLDEKQLMIPRSHFPAYVPGDVVAFATELDATQVELGMVHECGDDAVQLQMLLHRKCKTRFTWLPVWTTAAGVKRCTDQPADSDPVVALVLHERVLGKVTLTSGHKLDDNSLNFLEALGLQVDVKAHCG